MISTAVTEIQNALNRFAGPVNPVHICIDAFGKCVIHVGSFYSTPITGEEFEREVIRRERERLESLASGVTRTPSNIDRCQFRSTRQPAETPPDVEFRNMHMNDPPQPVPGRFLHLMPSELRPGLRVRTVKSDRRTGPWKDWAAAQRKFGITGTIREDSEKSYVVVEHDGGGCGYYEPCELQII
jgi:hypothetical protein